jgi:TolA-binding protein
MSTLPSDTPRLPKWPFVVADVCLLATAALIALRNPAPYSGGLVAAITICVVLGCILGAVPFLTDYAQRQDEALDERQRGLDALTRTIADSAEQISVAANSMHETLELTRRQINQIESMPDTLGDGFEELSQQVASKLSATTETLQKEIKAIKAGADNRKPDGTAEKLQQLHVRLEDLETKLTLQIAALSKAAPPPATPPVEPVPVATTPAPLEPPVVETPPAVIEPPPAAAQPTPVPVEAKPAPEAVKPVKKAAASKPTRPDAADELPFAESTPPAEFDPAAAKPTRTNTSDHATRLLVTAYIGIGNRLFIRGEGPGLSADKGIPLQFVSIGKWQWETKEATGPVRARLFKNDELACTSLGEITLETGQQLEVSATF